MKVFYFSLCFAEGKKGTEKGNKEDEVEWKYYNFFFVMRLSKVSLKKEGISLILNHF